MSFEYRHSNQFESPAPPEVTENRRRLVPKAVRTLAALAMVATPLVPAIEATVKGVNDPNKPFELANVYKAVSYYYATYDVDRDCSPELTDDRLEELSQRKLTGLAEPDGPAGVARRFDLTLIDSARAGEVIEAINQATDIPAVTDAVSQFTEEAYGFPTTIYRLENFDIPLTSYKANARILTTHLADLPVELYEGIDLKRLIIADKITQPSYFAEATQYRGMFYANSRTMVLSQYSMADYDTFMHEIMHGIHQQACGGVLPRHDSQLTDLNPINHQYVDEDWYNVSIDPAVLADRQANKNFKEDFAVTGAAIYSDRQVILDDYTSDLLPIVHKRALVEGRVDHVSGQGTSIYLDLLNASSRKVLPLPDSYN